MIQVELQIRNYILATDIIQVLMDEKLIGGYIYNKNGFYTFNIDGWYNIPRCLYPFINKPKFFRAEEMIRNLLSQDEEISQKYNLSIEELKKYNLFED